MSSLVLRSLSILLGLFFIFIGIMKISPHISKDLHRDLVGVSSPRVEVVCVCVRGVGKTSLELIMHLSALKSGPRVFILAANAIATIAQSSCG